MSNSLQSHGLQHETLPCPSLSSRVCSNSCPLNQWYYLTISSSATLFSFCLQSFPESGSFPMSQFFASGGQSIGATASVLSMNVQGWFPLGFFSLQSKGLSRVFCSNTVWKYQFFGTLSSNCPALTSIHDYWKDHNVDYMDLCWQSDVFYF